jgi:hypothetical protein
VYSGYDTIYISTVRSKHLHAEETTGSALSQKQFGKYLGLEVFPASMGIVPVLLEKICIQQHPRNKYL